MQTICATGSNYVFQSGEKYTLTGSEGNVLKEIMEDEARGMQYCRLHVLQAHPEVSVMGVLISQLGVGAYDIEYTAVGISFRRVSG
jgi:hypothetical protein